MDIEPQYQSINTNRTCTESCCIDNDDDRKIKCVKCKREVHFVCTKLPLYQLRLFFTKNYRSFICINCVEIPEEFKIKYATQKESIISQCQREVRACENIIMVQKENESKLINGLRKMKQQQNEKEGFKEIMENKFDEFERRIKETIKEEIMKNKKDTSNNKNKTPNEKRQNQKTNKSFANIVKSNQKNELIPQFRKLLQEQKIQEIEEERQKDVRKSNLIIYGIKEFEESTNGDEIFVNDLLIDLESKSKVKFMTRIGDRKKSQSRPLKVVFQSPHEVYLITKNLIKLRGNLKYQSISITEDLTWFERKVIKE